MKIKWRINLAVVALGILLTSVVWAQPPGGPGGMPGMRDNPKRKLETFVLSVGQLEKSGKAKLSATQAKKITTAISPWRKKSTMSAAQATELQKKLSVILTSAQKKEVESLRPRRGGGRESMRDGRGPGSGGPGGERNRGEMRRDGRQGGREGRGGPGPNGAQDKEFRQRMEKMRGFFNTYNPFYPAGSYKTVQEMPSRMQEGFKRRSDSINAVLTQLSKKAGRA